MPRALHMGVAHFPRRVSQIGDQIRSSMALHIKKKGSNYARLAIEFGYGILLRFLLV